MSKTTLLLAASVLILIGFVLLVLGLPEAEALWMAGLGTVSLAMLLSFATRWAREAAEEDEQEPDEEPAPRTSAAER